MKNRSHNIQVLQIDPKSQLATVNFVDTGMIMTVHIDLLNSTTGGGHPLPPPAIA